MNIDRKEWECAPRIGARLGRNVHRLANGMEVFGDPVSIIPDPAISDSEMLDWLSLRAESDDGIRIQAPFYNEPWKVGDEPAACDHSFSMEVFETRGEGSSLRQAIMRAIMREREVKP